MKAAASEDVGRLILKSHEETEKEAANCCLSYFSKREFPHRQAFKKRVKLQHTASNTSLSLVIY